MDDLSFDDLLPQGDAQPAAAPMSFDDLIPPTPAPRPGRGTVANPFGGDGPAAPEVSLSKAPDGGLSFDDLIPGGSPQPMAPEPPAAQHDMPNQAGAPFKLGVAVRPTLGTDTGYAPTGKWRVPGQGGLDAAGNQFAQSLTQGVGSLVGGLGDVPAGAVTNAQGVMARQLDIMKRIDKGDAVPETDDPLGYSSMSPEQRGTFRTAYEATVRREQEAAKDAPPNMLQRAGVTISDWASGKFPVDAGHTDDLLTKISGVAGGAAPLLAATAAGGPLAGAGLAGLQSYDGAYQGALAKGATQQQAHDAGLQSGLVGAALMGADGAVIVRGLPVQIQNSVVGGALDYVASGGTMMGAGQVQRMADNAIAQSTYDKKRDLFEGVGDVRDMLAEGVAGVGMHGAFHAPGQVRAGMDALRAPDAAPELRTGAVGITEAARDYRDAPVGQPESSEPEQPSVAGTPAVPAGHERFYHGGSDPTAGGPRWVTPDRDYAQGYADKSGSGVHYVDLPSDHPEIVRAFDDTGSDVRAPAVHFEASPEMAGQMKPLDAAPAKADSIAPADQAALQKLGYGADDIAQMTPTLGRALLDEAPTPAEAAPRSDAPITGGTFQQKAGGVVSRLMADLNLTHDQAAGVVGNLGHESGLEAINERNPTVAGSRGGFGWAQWTGSRRTEFEAYAADRGLSVKDPEANYGFLVHELQTTHRGDLNALRQAGSLEDATRTFEQTYEGAGIVAMDSRLKMARQAAGSDVSRETPVNATTAAPADTQPVYTNSGTRIDVRPEVVELSALTASHDNDGRVNPDFPHEKGMQPRDRSSATSQAQIQNIAANMQPERLAPSRDAGNGAPIVSPQGVVESGNGRTLAIGRAYADPALAPQAARYRDFLSSQGFDVSGMKQPVLVSRRVTPLDDAARADFARDANERSTLAMSQSEQARADAGRAQAAMPMWNGAGAGDASNQQFVRAFMARLPPEEAGAMRLKDGSLSPEGERRIQSAVTASAYGDAMGPTLDRALNGDSEGIKAVSGAMSDAAGSWAAMRAGAREGRIPPSLDLTPALTEAVETVARARQLNRPLAEVAGQADLDRAPMSPEGRMLLGAMFNDPGMKQPKARAKVAEVLRTYAEEAAKATPGPDMFGAPPPAAREVLAASLRAVAKKDAPPAKLFAMRDARFDWTPGYKLLDVGPTRVGYSVDKDGKGATIDTVKTPPEARGKGGARAALEQMAREADARGMALRLTSDPMDKATSKAKLDRFYQSLGFKRNAGSKRDFTTRAEFIRQPQDAPKFAMRPAGSDANHGALANTARRDAQQAHAATERDPDAGQLPTEAMAARDRLRTGMQAMMRFVGVPESVGLRLVDQIVAGAHGADGSYSRGLIEMALDTPPDQLPQKLFHETVHALLDPEMGLLSKGQRDTLYQGADAWLRQNPAGRSRLEALYGTDREMLREEAVARMGEEAFTAGVMAQRPATRVYGRLLNTMRGLGNVLRGQGFRTADDVFRGVLRGDRAMSGSREALAAAGPREALRGVAAQAGVPLPADMRTEPEAAPDAPKVEAAPMPEDATAAGIMRLGAAPDRYLSRRDAAPLLSDKPALERAGQNALPGFERTDRQAIDAGASAGVRSGQKGTDGLPLFERTMKAQPSLFSIRSRSRDFGAGGSSRDQGLIGRAPGAFASGRGDAAPLESGVDRGGVDAHSLGNLGDGDAVGGHGRGGVNVPSELDRLDGPDDAGLLKSKANIRSADAKRITDFSLARSGLEHSFGKLDAPAKAAMLRSVFSVAHDPKVLDAIIRGLPVDVMNMLRARQLAPKMAFHDPSVLSDLFSLDRDKPIALSVGEADRAMRLITGSAAKVLAAPRNLERSFGERGAALGAYNVDHGSTITYRDSDTKQNVPVEDMHKLSLRQNLAAAVRDGSEEPRRRLNKMLNEALYPMRAGSARAQDAAFKFANAIRGVQYRFGLIDQTITKQFNAQERSAMGKALDAQSVAEQQIRQMPLQDQAAARAAFEAGKTGLAGLTDKQRAVVETLDQLARQTWQRMEERGIVTPGADGIPHYFPRQFIKMEGLTGARRIAPEDNQIEAARQPSSGPRDANGVAVQSGGGGMTAMHPQGSNLNTRGPKAREHLTPEESAAAAQAKFGDGTQLVTDIRSLVDALSRQERAVAGRDLVDAIARMSKETGQELVVQGTKPERGYFTLDHPSLQTVGPTGAEDAEGKPLYGRIPMHIAEEFRGPMDAVLNQKNPDWYKAIQAVKSKSMGLIMFSPFMHLGVEVGRSLPLFKGNPLALASSMARAKKLVADRGFMDQATADGLAPIGRSWKQFDPVTLANEAADFSPKSALRKILSGDTAFGRAQHAIHAMLLWDQVFHLQAGIYNDMRAKYIDKGMPPKAAGIMAAHLANRYAGALPPEHLSSFANMAANLTMFSRSFTLGNLGVMKDVLTGMPSHIKAAIEQECGPDVRDKATSLLRRKAISAFVLDIGLFYGINALAQSGYSVLNNSLTMGFPAAAAQEWDTFKDSMMHGDLPQWRNEPGKDDRIYAGQDAGGRGIYARTPLGKVGEEFLGWGLHPGKMVLNKMSPMLRATWESVTGKDSMGRDVYNPHPESIAEHLGVARDIALHFAKAMTPYDFVSQVVDVARGQQTGDRGVAAARVLGPLLGLASISQGNPRGPQGGVEQAAADRAKYAANLAFPEAKKLVGQGKEDAARAVLEAAISDPKQVNAAMRSMLNPGKAQVRMDRTFARTADASQQDRAAHVTGGRGGPLGIAALAP